MPSKNFHRWSKEAWLAFLILVFTIVVSIFWEVYFCEGWETIYRGLIRFFRITLFLCLPLYLLSPVYSKLGVILRLRTGVLIQIVAKQKTEMHLEEMYTA